MSIPSSCKTAELFNAATGQKVAAGVSVSPTGNLMLAVPVTCKVEAGKQVNVNFLDSVLGVVTCRCVLTAPLATGDKRFLAYRCQVLERLAQKQRREDIKVNLNVRVNVMMDSTGVRAPAAVRNISASGVYLVTTLSAKPKDRLAFDFRAGDALIPLVAEVLRVETVHEQGHMGYGCRFVRLSPRHEAQLRSYVFKEERSQRKP